jgi:hypothetical protein
MSTTTSDSSKGDRSTLLLPNRIAVYMLIVFGIAAAVLPVAANMDWTSTAGVLGGLGAIAAALVTWLRGWTSGGSEEKHLEKYQPTASAQGNPRVAELEAEVTDLKGSVPKLRVELQEELEQLRSLVPALQKELRDANDHLARLDKQLIHK